MIKNRKNIILSLTIISTLLLSSISSPVYGQLWRERRAERAAKKAPGSPEIDPLTGFKKGYLMEFRVIDGDTVFLDNLEPIFVSPKAPKGKEGKKWREHYKTVHNFSKTYPYALIAKEKILEAERYLADNNLNDRERERFLKEFEKDLFAEFEKPLRGLTYNQGRILLRLIDREIGLTPYYIIKNYRGGAAAGFWQGVGKLFGADLKRPYAPLTLDKELEELVMFWERGEFPFLYRSIFGKFPDPVVRSVPSK